VFKNGQWGEERDTMGCGGVKKIIGSKTGILNILANITKVI